MKTANQEKITLDDVKIAREPYIKKQRLFKRVVVPICTCLLIILITLNVVLNNDKEFDANHFMLFGVLILLMVLVFWLINRFSSKKELEIYRRAYKSYFINKYHEKLKEHFMIEEYDHSKGMDKDMLFATGTIATGPVYYSDDYMSGSYKGVKFSQADIQINNTSDEYPNFFCGRWIIFEFPKKFNFRLHLNNGRAGAGIIPKGFKKFKTESSELNERFNIYAEDEFEGFNLLDPAMIDRLIKLGDEYRGRSFLTIIFADNQLHIAIDDNKDTFEPPVDITEKPLDETAELAKIERDICVITDFVDKLKLSKGIFQ